MTVLVMVLSCPVKGKKGGRMAVIPMLVFEFFFVDTGEQPLDNVRNLPIVKMSPGYEKRRMERAIWPSRKI